MMALFRAPRAMLCIWGAVMVLKCIGTATGQFIPVEECPLAPPCCEEDCCGAGTSWDPDTEYCVADSDSNGFDGSHSDDWVEGCIIRACCGANCCFSDTVYDEDISSCVPIPIGPGDQKEIGEECENNSDCKTGECYRGNIAPEFPGFCQCNPSDSAGCEEGFICYSEREISDAQGIADSPPACLLPVGSECSEDGSCLTRVCDEVTEICACNTFTNFPCDTDSGEACVVEDGSNVCKVPIPGSIGDFCEIDDDCVTGACYKITPSVDGVCSCNPDNGDGCLDGLICATPEDAFYFAQPPPGCYIPFGDPCLDSENTCLSGNCNEATNQCGCSFVTENPCDVENGERCLLDDDGTSYECQVLSDGEVGDPCFQDDECSTDSCVFDPPVPSGLGRCSCNAETGEGCAGDFECYNSNEIGEARGALVSVAPFCRLPVGSPCEKENEGLCLTDNCDEVTNLCACNTFTNFPCDTDIGEECILEGVGYVCKIPGPIEVPGEIGDDCLSDSDCATESCVLDPPNPQNIGRCTCNPDKEDDGCEGDFECKTSGEIGEAVGALVSVSPFCKLPVGAACEDSGSCLTDNCDEVTNLCACNAFTNVPCSAEEGGRCVQDFDGSFVCRAPGDGSLDSDCFEDSDCDTGVCFKGGLIPSDLPGFCVCDTEDNSGCDGGNICYSESEVSDARGIAASGGIGPGCYLPVGEPCEDEGSCVSDVCDTTTNLCACNSFTNWPCDTDSGEECVLDENDGYVCKIPGPIEGPGEIGDDCVSDSDCVTESCILVIPNPQDIKSCTCNPDKEDDGCEGDFECTTPGDVIEARGAVINVAPFCRLPVGAACEKENEGLCLTDNCDEVTNLCACNTFTNFPCDTDNGEECILDENEGYVCKIPGTNPGPGAQGDIGDDCQSDSDCKTESCVLDPPNPQNIGRCTCNPEKDDDGCSGDFICYSSNEIGQAVGALISVAPFCKLPVGAICDPDENDCLTESCDTTTNVCTCNSFTSWPCDVENEEQCLPDTDGVLVCRVPEDGDGSLGSDCNDDSECDSGSCYRDPQIPQDLSGFCVCDSESNAGCDGDFVCYSSGDLQDAQFLFDAPPGCYLPVGTDCTRDDQCVTATCDDTINQCACNRFAQFGCDKDGGEICTLGNGQTICKVPQDEPIGANCINNADCVSDSCFYGFQPADTPGVCSCNVDTNFGCEGDEFCATPGDLLEAQFLADAPQGCYLPFGASCNPDEFSCITGNCDKSTNTCGCNELSNYPCDTDAGEVCIVDNGTYTCGEPNAIGGSGTPIACPKFDGICTLEFAPVECSGCRYSNQCQATGANSSFTPETCTRVDSVRRSLGGSLRQK